MANKTYYWLRLKKDFFKSKEMKKLRKIAGGDTYTIIYLKMQLASLQNDGILYYEGLEDSFAEELALDLDEDSENVKVTVAFLVRCGLLVQDSESEFSMPETKECIGGETQGAARVRRYRDKKKALLCNASVTNGNTEKEIEIKKEIELDTEIKKKAKKPTAFDSYTENSFLSDAIKDFISMRKQIKAPMTDRAIRLMLQKLDTLASDDETKIAILNQSILNSWKGIFPLKDQQQTCTASRQLGGNTGNRAMDAAAAAIAMLQRQGEQDGQ